MTTVTGNIVTAAGDHPRGAGVTVTLVDQAGRAVPGFAGTTEVLGVVSVPVAADGSWSVSLTPSADVTSPRGPTLYQVTERVQTGVSASYYISVPATGPAWVGSLRVTLPGSADELLVGYLPLTGGTVSGPIVLADASPAASEAYVASHGGGGGGGTPSGTVVSETAYGQAATAGAAATFARGDHTHGTPALPAPAEIGAATAGHTHAGVYDPAGTAAAAVSAHEAAGDPHPQYLTGAEGNAAYAAVGHTHPDVFPISGYGLLALSGVPEAFMLGSSASNNTIFSARVWVPAGVTITSLWAAVRAAGTYSGSATPNRLGLYTDAGVQVALTPDDSTLWSAAGWRGGALTGGPIAAQGTGRFVYILMIFGGYANVVLPYPSAANDAQVPWFCTGVGVTRRRAMYAGGTAMPASFDPTAYGTATTYVPLVGVS